MSLFDIIFPKRCVSCGVVGGYICRACGKQIHLLQQADSICPVCCKHSILGVTHVLCRSKYSMNGLISVYQYNGPIKQLIKAIKYRFVYDMVQEGFDHIPKSVMDSTLELVGRDSEIIPIPLHVSRLKYRGFNQAEKIAQILGKKLSIAVTTDALQRIRASIPQVEMLSKQERTRNIIGAFAIRGDDQNRIYGKNILLCDDVWTTGSTMREAGKVLKQSGAKAVWGFSLAR